MPLLYANLMAIATNLVVSSRGMLVKSELLPKLPIKLLEFWSTISVTKLNESLTMYYLIVNGSLAGTKNFCKLVCGCL